MALLVLELLAAFAVPLATGEEGYCAAGQDKPPQSLDVMIKWKQPGADKDCPADKPKKAKVRSCSVPDGREVVPPRMLALQAAAKECFAAAANIISTTQKNQEYEFRFVTGQILKNSGRGGGRELDCSIRRWRAHAPQHLNTKEVLGLQTVRENPPIAKFDGFLSEICLALGRS
ncbi:hypothetical protein AK812_SmicGene34401 [Symbiodinium microadriaticum]|uniref:Uncharacterized protein n=1 Tax=Symbiodinium microadriaticum TaxID=2951 RepID=A0A1Q9CP51_SYMMI|nr:hypothetical protein AK812_SmicGene34401 [Symbiodinium microadriaticum]